MRTTHSLIDIDRHWWLAVAVCGSLNRSPENRISQRSTLEYWIPLGDVPCSVPLLGALAHFHSLSLSLVVKALLPRPAREANQNSHDFIPDTY